MGERKDRGGRAEGNVNEWSQHWVRMPEELGRVDAVKGRKQPVKRARGGEAKELQKVPGEEMVSLQMLAGVRGVEPREHVEEWPQSQAGA